MPNINLPTIDFTINSGSNKQELQQILDTLTKYRKELNFLLMNLDGENMPAIAGYIEDAFGNISSIQQTIDGINITVSNALGDISSLQVQADNISALVGNNAGDIASLAIRAGLIQTMVGNNAGDISTLTQTAQGIQTQVTNNAGQISSVVQTVNGIQSTVASHTTELGSVYSTITQLSTSISSKVSYSDYTGTEIVSLIEQTPNSIKLSASKIDLTGVTTLYSTTEGKYARYNAQGDFTTYEGGSPIFTIYNSLSGGVSLSFFENSFIGYHQMVNEATPMGVWNFGSATIKNLSARYG